MSSLLVTTSRKPSQATRKLCRWLAWVLNAECENRGKRSLPEMEELAEARGRRRMVFISEKQGNPSSLSFFEEEWLWPEIRLTGVQVPEPRPKGRPPKTTAVIAEDAAGEKIAGLFMLEKEEEAEAEMRASGRKLEFFLHGKPAGLALKISALKEGGTSEGRD